MRHATPTAAVLALALSLAGCASTDSSKVTAAATTPLSDLNLVNAPIPELLQAAQRAPYAVPADRSCPALAAMVKVLDEALGPDIDAPPGAEPGLLEKGGDLAVEALGRSAAGLVPLRSWVRKLTGAEHYSRQVAAAITAGGVRRGFLKGQQQAGGCRP
jgi:hypothetical protein